MHENLGRRIAGHRAKLGFTQQDLADRLGISRVAVSHLESGLSTPGERTVVLMASVFKTDPLDLVADTDYPIAKAERLPLVVARYTEVEHQLALLDNDLEWCEQVPLPLARAVLERWQARLAFLADVSHDRGEREMLTQARRRLSGLLADLGR